MRFDVCANQGRYLQPVWLKADSMLLALSVTTHTTLLFNPHLVATVFNFSVIFSAVWSQLNSKVSRAADLRCQVSVMNWTVTRQYDCVCREVQMSVDSSNSFFTFCFIHWYFSGKMFCKIVRLLVIFHQESLDQAALISFENC